MSLEFLVALMIPMLTMAASVYLFLSPVTNPYGIMTAELSPLIMYCPCSSCARCSP